ncbi:MAG: hypothetical protein ACLP1D_20130 [Xanthobacteraceae bacterium]
MTSRVSWSVEGIEPSVRERAEAAARRAGLSLNEWLNSTIGEPAPHPGNPAEVADIHHRLDSISRQIELMSQAAAPRAEGSGVARQLNDAISRLDARLSQLPAEPPRMMPAPPPRPPAPPRAAPERAAEPPRQTTIPELLQFDVAEIRARQSQLNDAPRAIQPAAAPPLAPSVAAPDLSGFEAKLQHLTSQIESLRRSDGVDQAIAAFRSELAEMRQAITDALPRRALESLEQEIRAVARRIDESRQSGADSDTLQAIEQALRDIYATLRTLTPAEQLAGFDDAIRNLGGKIDMIVRTSADSSTMQQLEGTIGALRGIVSNVASNEALARLSDDVQTLAAKVDQLTPDREFAGSLAALEHRIALLTSSLENRERGGGDTGHLEQAVQVLSDRIDHLQVGGDASAAFAHVEQRVQQLLERLEFADSRMANFGRVEEGLSDILRHLEQQRTSLAALREDRAPPLAPAAPAPAMDPEVVDAIRRELSDLRLSRSESDRNTQDALESVHNTLGHVVDRLAMIEGDLRESRNARAVAPEWPSAQNVVAAQGVRAPAAPLVSSTALSAPMPASRDWVLPEPRPELPNPAAAAPTATFVPPFVDVPPVPALKDILLGGAPGDAAPPAAPRDAQIPRAPIDASLPPDFPLEPGTRPQDRAAAAPPPTPSQRIAASEQVLSEIPAPSRQATSSSNFIAAARRAAQAAANPARDASSDKPRHVNVLDNKSRAAGAGAGAASKLTSKIRSLLVGVSVVVIVLSGFKMAMTMLEGGGAPAPAERPLDPPQEKSSDAAPLMPAPDAGRGTPSRAAEFTLPAITSPTPMERQGNNGAVESMSAPEPHDGATAAKPSDITGTVVAPQSAVMPAPAADRRAPAPAAPASFSPVSDALPGSIGGPVLRAAALRGDPTAAFEVAARFSDGRGVPVNYDEAAKWFDRAADGGIVPAMFRLGTMYEKGLGGKKDVDAARRYYIRAAERGNAKAMHNLAVLDADGGSKGPNYKSAAQWFQKAAEHGVADSQFNLGILYARGIGVEQNLAESFKWFSLAAAQGDADAGRKRDDVAKRLDPQSLAAAKLAIQTFVAEPQPDDALNVAAPAAGWDATPAGVPKSAPKRGARMAAATPRPTPSTH